MSKTTKREWIYLALIVILLSALAGEMDKQDYGVNGHGQVESQESQ